MTHSFCTVSFIQRTIISIILKLERLVFLPLLGIRLWIANIFWKSGQVKLSDWQGTVALFEDEYQVPLLPPELAAYMGTAAEIICPVLLLVGLGSRFAALSLLMMTAVIEFTYFHSDTHLVWALMLSLILFYGAGAASVDYLIRRKFANL